LRCPRSTSDQDNGARKDNDLGDKHSYDDPMKMIIELSMAMMTMMVSMMLVIFVVRVMIVTGISIGIMAIR
jgi:hypothetical protein